MAGDRTARVYCLRPDSFGRAVAANLVELATSQVSSRRTVRPNRWVDLAFRTISLSGGPMMKRVPENRTATCSLTACRGRNMPASYSFLI